jgi:two-component system, NtrC family, sensor histidine kinase PilS
VIPVVDADPKSSKSSPSRRGPDPRDDLPDPHRKIVYLMVFRTGLITVLFGVIVAVLLLSDRPLRLATRHSQAIFMLIIAAYACSLFYAALFKSIRHKERFYAIQVGVDVVLVSTLVHLTGGVNSVYTFLFPLLIVQATIVFFSRGALVTTVAVALMFVVVAVGGWVRFIPPVAQQPTMPWWASVQELVQYLVLNLGGQICIAILSAFLAAQLRSADRRVLEQRLTIRDMVRLNENVLQSLQTGLITVDRAGLIMSANQAASQLLGRSQNQMSALTLQDVLPRIQVEVPDEGSQRLRTTLETTSEGGSPTPVEIRISPLWDRAQQRSGSLVLLEDLTEISSMEDRVKRAERLAALGRLSAGIAHEIRNPLASVSGCLELLQAGPDFAEEDQRLMGIAVREVDRLAALVTNLLEYARPRPLMRMELDLLDLAREVSAACAKDPAFARISVEITGAEEAGECLVDVDTAQLRQVLWNLYRNAAEVMAKTASEGEDDAAARDAGDADDPVEKSTIEVDVRRLDHAGSPGVRVTVTDHGPGIPAEDQDHIFEPFFTTKDEGTGLGLAIVYRIVEEHEGTIYVQSPVVQETGTRFSLHFPDRQK